jgi:hypothetical protein
VKEGGWKWAEGVIGPAVGMTLRRMQVDTRKWAMSKLAPKPYGENVAVDHGVQDSMASCCKRSPRRTAGRRARD